jgi:hypothetical protein
LICTLLRPVSATGGIMPAAKRITGTNAVSFGHRMEKNALSC